MPFTVRHQDRGTCQAGEVGLWGWAPQEAKATRLVCGVPCRPLSNSDCRTQSGIPVQAPRIRQEPWVTWIQLVLNQYLSFLETLV